MASLAITIRGGAWNLRRYSGLPRLGQSQPALRPERWSVSQHTPPVGAKSAVVRETAAERFDEFGGRDGADGGPWTYA